jgi:DNA polymerase-3 subunit alpha
MQMAVKVGFTLDEAEQLRRIVGKKKIELMPAWKKKIEDKILENNLPDEAGEILWRVAEDSANYSFNKSHSISYSFLAAWTTYLKFKYPQEFFLSLLKMTKFEPSPQEEINKVCQELPRLSYFRLT